MKFQKLTPNLAVKDVSQTVNYYQDTLGFKLEMAFRAGSTTIENKLSDQGEYAYAMVRNDEVFIMFLRADYFEKDIPVLKGFSQGASVLFYIDVEGIDEVYNEIKNRVEIVKRLETTWYGMREFHIKDCNGYLLGFAEKE